jgi:hypothetical protein
MDPPASGSVRPSRRDFLKLTSLAAVAAASRAAGATPLFDAPASAPRSLRGNSLPGRIVLYHEAGMHGQGTIDLARVEAAVHHGVRLLTGIDDTAGAFESLFPGLTSTSAIAIKVNCIGPCDTRWETVRGIVAGLKLMLGGTYDISHACIYDNRYIGGSHGYTNANFNFGGVYPQIASGPVCNTNYYPVSGHELSDYPFNCDYLINVPALKSHLEPHEITLALKNHYGSCCPPDICGSGGPPTMLALNADAHIRDKTALIVADALRGTYNGGPEVSPQSWLGYAETTPNTLFFSTDPITSDYWAREYINAERALHGWSPKPVTWIEDGAGSPYYLGICDPAAMDVVRFDPAGIPDGVHAAQLGIQLEPNVPNPFRDQTRLRLRLERPVRARVAIVDAAGRAVRDLGAHDLAAGTADLTWDGRDDLGRAAGAGVYLVRVETGAARVARRILKL